MTLPAVSLIGTGSLGSTLLRAFSSSNIPVSGCYNRSSSRARALRDDLFPGVRAAEFPENTSELGELVLVTVADQQIEKTAERLAGLAGTWEGYHVAHCSGTLTSDVLYSLREKGAACASFHPLQTFTPSSDSEEFHDIYFGCEGNEETVTLLADLADRLGASVLRLAPEEKPYIHLAAVFASNYVMALMHTAGKAGAHGGAGPKTLQKALTPLMRQTAENISQKGLKNALSGPIARGDAETVNRHLELLADAPELRELYRRLGQEMLDLVKKSKNVPGDETMEYLEKLMER